MQEIFRSRDMALLVLKRQFLEENDIPCRIFQAGTDITDMPAHPVYGMAYHLEQAGALMVDEEDERNAWNLLNNIENPVEIEEELDLEAVLQHEKEVRARALKIFFVLFYLAFSAIWLFYATRFISVLWAYPGSEDALRDPGFLPVGLIMVTAWIISFFVILLSKSKRP